MDALRRAVEEDRLVLLPVELALTGEERYTLPEIAEKTDLDEEFVFDAVMALGLPRPGPRRAPGHRGRPRVDAGGQVLPRLRDLAAVSPGDHAGDR
ncbi:MAG: hypothetical protein WKF31_05720 [Thermoleophilaceae bacterium]